MSAFITATAKGCIVILFGIAAAPGCQGTMVWLSLSRTADVDPAVHVEVRLDGTLAKTYTLIPVDPPAIKRIDIERSAAVVTIKERALVADHVVAQITAEWSGGTFLWIVGRARHQRQRRRERGRRRCGPGRAERRRSVGLRGRLGTDRRGRRRRRGA